MSARPVLSARRCAAAVLSMLLLTAACARNPALPDDPAEILAAAIRSTQETKALHFTIDGQGEVTIPNKPVEELLFGATGNLQFPASVHMTMTIDRPNERGVQQELLYIDKILFVRAAGSQGAWQKTASQVQIPGFDPLTAFDLETFEKTSEVRDAGEETYQGIPARRLRITPTDEFRAKAKASLPQPDFAETDLQVTTDMWIDSRTKRIRRVVQRFEYTGRTTGFFQSEMRFSEFGLDVEIGEPPADQVAEDPVQVPTLPGQTGR